MVRGIARRAARLARGSFRSRCASGFILGQPGGRAGNIACRAEGIPRRVFQWCSSRLFALGTRAAHECGGGIDGCGLGSSVLLGRFTEWLARCLSCSRHRACSLLASGKRCALCIRSLASNGQGAVFLCGVLRGPRACAQAHSDSCGLCACGGGFNRGAGGHQEAPLRQLIRNEERMALSFGKPHDHRPWYLRPSSHHCR